MSRLVRLLPVGKMDYAQCLKLQRLVSDEVKGNRSPDTVIIVEHNPVYTIGIRQKDYLKDEAKLLELGAQFCKVDRGGLITFHGPGQLVAYPILDIRRYNVNVRCYVKKLEDTVIDLCKGFSVKAGTTSDTGVWVNDRKICALGIRVSRYVTTHGLALNCNVDLSWFSHIVPCGLEGKEVTSLSRELSREVTLDEALPKFMDSFGRVFSAEFAAVENWEILNMLERLKI